MRKVFTIVTIIAIGLPLLYAVYWVLTQGLKLSDTFWSGAMGNWLATVVGVAAGIPIALWLYGLQQKGELATLEKENKSRKARILELVKNELAFNLDQLVKSKTESEGVEQRVVFVPGLKNELWSAFSDGGELQWINDLAMLNHISFAYYYIRTIIFLENLYLEVNYFPGVQMKNSQKENIIHTLNGFESGAIKFIGRALQEIENGLAEMKRDPDLKS